MGWRAVRLETIITKSRFCKRCDAMVRWQCECSPRDAMAWQRTNVFHMGKRYKGKKAWEKTHPDIKYTKSDTNQ